jgi:CBS domain-containing protein
MKVGIKVGDVMTKKLVTVKPETPISECAKIMIDKRIGSILVGEKQMLKGIATEGDIITAVAKGINVKDSISKVMTKKVITIPPTRDIYDALVVMKKNKVRWLPVTADKAIIGFLTEKDILKIQPDLFDIAVQNINIAEEAEKWKRIKAVDEYRWIKEGPCHECGVYDLLYKADGRYLCADCRKKAEGSWEE